MFSQINAQEGRLEERYGRLNSRLIDLTFHDVGGPESARCWYASPAARDQIRCFVNGPAEKRAVRIVL